MKQMEQNCDDRKHKCPRSDASIQHKIYCSWLRSGDLSNQDFSKCDHMFHCLSFPFLGTTCREHIAFAAFVDEN